MIIFEQKEKKAIPSKKGKNNYMPSPHPASLNPPNSYRRLLTHLDTNRNIRTPPNPPFKILINIKLNTKI